MILPRTPPYQLSDRYRSQRSASHRWRRLVDEFRLFTLPWNQFFCRSARGLRWRTVEVSLPLLIDRPRIAQGFSSILIPPRLLDCLCRTAQQVLSAVQTALAQNGASHVTMVGHSLGACAHGVLSPCCILLSRLVFYSSDGFRCCALSAGLRLFAIAHSWRHVQDRSLRAASG